MFLKLLEKLSIYEDGAPVFGGDVEETLREVALADFVWQKDHPVAALVHATTATAHAFGSVRALYDLGLLVACEPPADGEVVVHSARARLLLRMVAVWNRTTPIPDDESEDDAIWRELLEDHEQLYVENVALEIKQAVEADVDHDVDRAACENPMEAHCASCGDSMPSANVWLFKGYCHACTAGAAVLNQKALDAARQLLGECDVDSVTGCDNEPRLDISPEALRSEAQWMREIHQAEVAPRMVTMAPGPAVALERAAATIEALATDLGAEQEAHAHAAEDVCDPHACSTVDFLNDDLAAALARAELAEAALTTLTEAAEWVAGLISDTGLEVSVDEGEGDREYTAGDMARRLREAIGREPTVTALADDPPKEVAP
jgi:hypothetical protein